jgi:uncharacterized phage protein (TIGR01671 family)
MNRVIKFRAWDALNKQWLLGYELPNLGGFSMLGEVMVFGEYQRMLSSFSLDDWDKIILMQFTGLLDKNGKEIYEGDIVKWYNKISYIVYMDKGFWVNDEAYGWEGEDLWNWEQMEVIGNIYENPELISK